MEAVKQHVRDLEEALATMRGALATATGNEAGIKSRLASTQAKIDTTTSNIEILLSDEDLGNDKFADKLGASLVDLEAEARDQRIELGAASAELSSLEEAQERLEAKVSEMQGNLRRLASLERAAQAKERAAQSLRAASEALGAGEGSSVDSVEARLRARAGTADATFSQAMGELDGAGGAEAAVRSSQGASRVAQIRARLAAQKAAAQE